MTQQDNYPIEFLSYIFQTYIQEQQKCQPSAHID